MGRKFFLNLPLRTRICIATFSEASVTLINLLS